MNNKYTATENRVILASESPRRSDLMNLLRIDFEIQPSHIDESIEEGVKAEEAVIEIARRKGMFISSKLKDVSDLTIISADTTVVLDEIMLGKPESRDDAINILKKLSGHSHRVLTGVFVIARKDSTEEYFSGVEVSSVHFRSLRDQEISAYVDSGEPMDKAGAYALQGLGSALVESISGCYTNIIGLPIPLTVSLLRKAGLQILGCHNID